MADCCRWCSDADRAWGRVRMERFPKPVDEGTGMDHLGSDLRFRACELDSGLRCLRQRDTDEADWAARPVAFTAAVLYGLGTALASAANNLTALYLAYRVVAGADRGLGCIVRIVPLVSASAEGTSFPFPHFRRREQCARHH